MKNTFVAVVLCMALLSSFTVSASAEFTSSDSSTLSHIYTQLTAIFNELGYPSGGFSHLREAVNYIANHLPGSPYDYSTVLANIKSNSDSLVSYISLIEGDTNSMSDKVTKILNLLNDVYVRQGVMQIAITDHIDSASTQNHNDLTSFATQNHSDLTTFNSDFSRMFGINLSDEDSSYFHGSHVYPFFGSAGDIIWAEWPYAFGYVLQSLSGDHVTMNGYRSLYGIVHQMQQVLASDDDLQLKKDNKANEDAATDSFVNGSSSKTSLGTGDIGNLKDVGGTFNDLTSLNGQSSVSSFLSGLASADGTGQGWFSEATRASLDAVSPVPTTKARVFNTYRGERSSVYSIVPDVSLVSPDMYYEPVMSSPSLPLDDPYNMSGFEDNYYWLWGDAS